LADTQKRERVIDRKKSKACLLLLALALVSLMGMGGQVGTEEPDVAPSDVSGQGREVMPVVSDDVKHDVSPELRSISPVLPEPGEGEPREIPLFVRPKGKGVSNEGDCSDF
jgi:hypothetical protein